MRTKAGALEKHWSAPGEFCLQGRAPRCHPTFTPKGGCVGPALHSLLHPASLEVVERCGLLLGRGATGHPVTIWVSSTCERTVVHEAGAEPSLTALTEVGCCECTRVHPCWALGLCWWPSPCSAEARVRSIQDLPPCLQTSCHRPAQRTYF